MGAADKQDRVHAKKVTECATKLRLMELIYVNPIRKTQNFVECLLGITVYLDVQGHNFVTTFRGNSVLSGLDHLWGIWSKLAKLPVPGLV